MDTFEVDAKVYAALAYPIARRVFSTLLWPSCATHLARCRHVTRYPKDRELLIN